MLRTREPEPVCAKCSCLNSQFELFFAHRHRWTVPFLECFAAVLAACEGVCTDLGERALSGCFQRFVPLISCENQTQAMEVILCTPIEVPHCDDLYRPMTWPSFQASSTDARFYACDPGFSYYINYGNHGAPQSSVNNGRFIVTIHSTKAKSFVVCCILLSLFVDP